MPAAVAVGEQGDAVPTVVLGDSLHLPGDVGEGLVPGARTALRARFTTEAVTVVELAGEELQDATTVRRIVFRMPTPDVTGLVAVGLRDTDDSGSNLRIGLRVSTLFTREGVDGAPERGDTS